MSVSRRALTVALLALLASALAGTQSARAAETKAVTCGGLAGAAAKAAAGDVLRLGAETCKVNLAIANTAAFTIEGAPAGGTTLEPEKAAEAIVQGEGSVTFTLAGLTFTGATKASAVKFIGAPSTSEAVTLRGDTFAHNHIESFGGAVSISQGMLSGAPTVITGCTFTDNSSEFGGAIQIDAGGPMQITNNRFTANAAEFDGGALYMFDFNETSPYPVVVEGNTFGGSLSGEGNIAREWGGGAVVSVSKEQPVTIARNTFEGNRITGSHTAVGDREGAGLLVSQNYAHLAFPVTQHDNSFIENVIDETVKPGLKEPLAAGGAGEWIRGVPVTSTDDMFVRNRIAVADGRPPEGAGLGAIATAETGAVPEQPASFSGSDDLFRENSIVAGGWGAALYVGGPAPDCIGTCPASRMTLSDSTIISNSVQPGPGSEGGAIWGSPNDQLTVLNSIISRNPPEPQVFGFASTAPSFAYSDICNEAGGPAVQSGAGNICADPLLASDGSETASSPTIDAGSNPLIPEGVTLDLADAPRIVSSRQGCGGPLPAVVDMGAFEYQQQLPVPPCAPPPGSAPVTPVLTSVAQSHSSWRVGSRAASIARRRAPVGTTFSFSLNEPARVTLAFTEALPGRRVHGHCVAAKRANRHRHACRRAVSRGTLTFSAHSGADAISFQGRLSSSHKLTPGSYSLAITATDAGGRRSATARLAFRIVR